LLNHSEYAQETGERCGLRENSWSGSNPTSLVGIDTGGVNEGQNTVLTKIGWENKITSIHVSFNEKRISPPCVRRGTGKRQKRGMQKNGGKKA